MKLSEHFSSAEFACHCGCGADTVSPKLVDLLELIRTKSGKPVSILSGRRCAKQNKACGGVKNSQHMLGHAADIRIQGMTPHQVHSLVSKIHQDGGLHVGGLGIYPTFVHVDVRAVLARWEGK